MVVTKGRFINLFILISLSILCYLVFFRQLGLFTSRIWDESRNGVNALEMIKTKNPIVTYFHQSPDMWNTKPPFYIWIVVIMFKLFGANELTLRLPSAIAATLVTFSIFIFSFKILKNKWIGLLGSLILISSMGFPDIHIGRTGDYDAMLTLFVFLGSLMFFIYLENRLAKYLWLTGLFFIMAVLTKGIAGMMIFPGIFIYLLISKNLLKLIKDKNFYKVLLIYILIIGGYYIGREYLNHGYLKAVWNEEIFGRTKNNLGANGNNFWYYWEMFSSFRFQKWIYFVPLSIFIWLFGKNRKNKKIVLFSWLISLSYFLIISYSGTKQMWYDAQMYPFMSLMVAIFLVEIINKLPILLRLFPLLILCFYMQRYVRTNIAYINRPDLEKSDSCLKYGYLFRDITIDKTGFVGVHKADWCTPISFYLEKNNLKRKNINELKSKEKVLTCDSITFNEIKEKYKIKPIFDNKDGCLGFSIE